MAALCASVGENARNLRPDVRTVQNLLKAKGFNPGIVDGMCGANTIAAIGAFQRTFMPQPTRRIDPGSDSAKRLTSALAMSPAPKPTSWTGDSAQWSQQKKLQSLRPDFRRKVEAVVRALAGRGFQPKIFFGWRSVAVQLAIYARGDSKVKFSFHCAQLPDGTPNSYAADIIDSRYAWSPTAQSSGFWDALGAEAKVQGLYWGGDWASFRDWAHVQLVPNSQLGAVKRESGL
jgi:peptidoglycan L-alanyl-D-glutamate endopeptidase CwlK